MRKKCLTIRQTPLKAQLDYVTDICFYFLFVFSSLILLFLNKKKNPFFNILPKITATKLTELSIKEERKTPYNIFIIMLCIFGFKCIDIFQHAVQADQIRDIQIKKMQHHIRIVYLRITLLLPCTRNYACFYA